MVRAMFSPIRLPQRLALTRDEIARFVENVVGGQQDFGLPQQHAAGPDYRGAVGGLLPVGEWDRPT